MSSRSGVPLAATWSRPGRDASRQASHPALRTWLCLALALGACSDASTEPPVDAPALDSASLEASWLRLERARAPLALHARDLEAQPDGASRDPLRVAPSLTAELETSLSRTAEGLVATSTLNPTHPVAVRLPARAHEAFRVASDGLAIEARLLGASETEAQLVDGIALYPGALEGADVLHRVTSTGTEDFVSFPVAPIRPELRYEVSLGEGVAGLRLFGGILELLDASGTPRLRVDVPYGVDATGERFEARLEVPDCAVDQDPRGPWGRPTTDPGARTCTVVVTWSDEVTYPAVVDPAWAATGSVFSLNIASYDLVQFDDGRVLLAGHGAPGSALWHPVTGTWSATGAVGFAVANGMASVVRVRGNRALLAGGQRDGDAGHGGFGVPQPNAAVYSPASGTWTTVANLPSPRTRQSAMTLPDGRGAIVGGYVYGEHAVRGYVHAYDPDTNAWAARASRPVGIRDHGMTDLGGGRYFSHGSMTGGGGCEESDGRAYVYNATTNAWSAAGTALVARGHTNGTRLPDGRVFVPGSTQCGGTAEVWNPATNTFRAVGGAVVGWGNGRLRTVPWGDHFLLVLPATPTRATQRFDVRTNGLTAGSDMVYANPVVTLITLRDGRVLAVHADRTSEVIAVPPTISTPAQGSTTTSPTPTIAGTCVPGATVTVREGATTLCAATCGAAGTFSCVASTLTYGPHTIHATQSVSGTMSGPSANRDFTVVPAAPSISTPTEGSATAERQPAISGTCVTGATVTVREGAATVCTATCVAASFSCTPSAPLSYGGHTITATQSVGGQTSATSPNRTFTVVQCTLSAHCGGATPYCDASSSTCVACTMASHCNDGNPCTTDACSAANTCTHTTLPAGSTCPGGVCSGASRMCVQCVSDAQCGGATPRCDLSTNACVTCTSDAHCGGATPYCNPGTSTCVACTSAAHCNDGNPCTASACTAGNVCTHTSVPAGTTCPGGVCSGASQMCVQCVSDAQCGGAAPRCDTSSNACVGCVTNAHCDDGNECTTNACGAGGCSTVARAAGSACSLGVCTPSATCAPVTVDIVTPADGSAVGTSTPTITGTGTPGATVSVSVDGAVIGTTTVGPDGTWSVPVTTPLPDGPHTATATVTTSNGVDMDMSTFTVDTETYVSITTPEDGGTTYERRPRITGTGEPGATVVVTLDGEEIGTVTVDADGTWTLRVPESVPNGEYTVEVTATDPVGNTATDTSTFTVDVGTEVIITTPADESVTNDSTPTITGTAEPGVTVVVTIVVDGEVVQIGTTTAGEDGTWSVPVTTPLPDGSHTVTATGTDPDGNIGVDTTRFTVDTETTVKITGVDPTTGVITGTGEPGATVVVTVDGVPVGTTTVDEDGTWVVEIDPLGPGTHTVTATGTDPAGNTDSDTTTVTVPTTDGGVVAPDGGPSADGGVEPAPRRQGRYSGGALCATSTPTGEGDPTAPWLVLGLALALVWRRRR